ncbi:hypothetical protein [Lactococcus cremoris]|uniref:hypothetical protein n=1 Tax=Lactococcus lactis subsp. cremoris TaxID=1359 RepID=UPI002FC92724
MELNNLKDSLTTLKYGEIATVAMIDRGAYAEIEESIEAETKDDSKVDSGVFKELAAIVKDKDEDLVVVGRSDIEHALTTEDFAHFIGQMTKEKHIVLVECLYLGTTEIKGFLNALKEQGLLENSKLILLDLPQLEYMMLRDSLAGQFKL